MDKRELADFLNEEVDKKSIISNDLWIDLEKEMKAYLEGGSVYVNNQDSKDSSGMGEDSEWYVRLLSKPSEKDDTDTEK